MIVPTPETDPTLGKKAPADEPALPGDGPLLRRLRRVTSSKSYIPAIDGWRFLAITWVFFCHLLYLTKPDGMSFDEAALESPLLWLARHGAKGVLVFVVISGYIIGLPFAKAARRGQRVSLRKYFVRRVTRLEPPFIIATLIVFAALLAKGTISPSERLPNLLATLTYSHVLLFHEHSTINTVTWSLETEVLFYIAAPLLAVLFTPRSAPLRRSCMIALAALCALARAKLANDASWMVFTMPPNAGFFLAGFVLADMHADRPPGQQPKSWWWDVVALGCGGLFIASMAVGNAWVANLAYPTLTAIAIHAVMRGVLTLRLFSLPWLTAIGGMCYTIYLYHYPFLRNTLRFTEGLTEGLPLAQRVLGQALVLTPIVLTICTALYLLFEKPFMYPDWPGRVASFFVRGRAEGREGEG